MTLSLKPPRVDLVKSLGLSLGSLTKEDVKFKLELTEL